MSVYPKFYRACLLGKNNHDCKTRICKFPYKQLSDKAL